MNIKTIKKALEFYELHPEKFYDYMQGYVDGVSEVTNISIADDDIIETKKEELPIGVWIKHEGRENPLEGLDSDTLTYQINVLSNTYHEDSIWCSFDLFEQEFTDINHEDRVLEYKIISL